MEARIQEGLAQPSPHPSAARRRGGSRAQSRGLLSAQNLTKLLVVYLEHLWTSLDTKYLNVEQSETLHVK